jgi:hypothetical protein
MEKTKRRRTTATTSRVVGLGQPTASQQPINQPATAPFLPSSPPPYHHPVPSSPLLSSRLPRARARILHVRAGTEQTTTPPARAHTHFGRQGDREEEEEEEEEEYIHIYAGQGAS